MIQGGIITKVGSDIDPKISGEIYDGINYICMLNNCNSIKKLFPKKYKEFLIEHKETFEKNLLLSSEITPNGKDIKIEREYKEPSRWEIVNAITEKIWVERYYEQNQNEERYYNFSIDYGSSEHFPISVAWYNQLIRINQNGINERSNTYARIDLIKKTLSVVIDWDLKETIDIQSVFDDLEALSDADGRTNLNSNEMIFNIIWKTLEARLFLENISFYKDPDETEAYRWYTNWYILIR